MSRRRGFSLPDLLAALSVAGVLACCALAALPPALRHARRAAAAAALIELAARQERHLARHGCYALEPAALGWQQSADGSAPWPGPSSAWYVLRLQAAPSTLPGAAGYQAVAAPVGAQGLDACGPLGIDHSGRRQPELPRCW